MSKAEILQELPKLKPEERREVLERIWAIDENAIVNGNVDPSNEEKRMLDQELADYRANPTDGATWEAVESRLAEPPRQ